VVRVYIAVEVEDAVPAVVQVDIAVEVEDATPAVAVAAVQALSEVAAAVGPDVPAVEQDASAAVRDGSAVGRVSSAVGPDDFRVGRVWSGVGLGGSPVDQDALVEPVDGSQVGRGGYRDWGVGCRVAPRWDVRRQQRQDGPCSGCRTADGSEQPGAGSGAGSTWAEYEVPALPPVQMPEAVR